MTITLEHIEAEHSRIAALIEEFKKQPKATEYRIDAATIPLAADSAQDVARAPLTAEQRKSMEHALWNFERNGFVADAKNLRDLLAAPATPAVMPRPEDDVMWDQTLQERDEYHDWADKLAAAIALYLGVDIGEHSNANCPWEEALEAIENEFAAGALLPATPSAPAVAPAPSDELASMTRMFHAACADLGAINEALGLDPEDGGAEPILDAIAELKRERDQWVDANYAVPAAAPAEPFQARVHPWMLACFGAAIAGDREERNHRFFEEAAELVQACGMTASEAHQLVDYTWSRPIGERHQEVGGVMVTLAALCLANGLDMHAAGETELARISSPATMAKIRAKQAAKPKHSPLPIAVEPAMETFEQWIVTLTESDKEVFLREWYAQTEARDSAPAQAEQQGDGGERSWQHTSSMLAILMCGFATRDGSRNVDAAKKVLDVATRADMPLAWLRTAEQPSARVALSEQAVQRAVNEFYLTHGDMFSRMKAALLAASAADGCNREQG